MFSTKTKEMARAIVHMDLDTFFVSCERLTNSELEGIPLIIGGGDRGVVASCSYEATTFWSAFGHAHSHGDETLSTSQNYERRYGIIFQIIT